MKILDRYLAKAVVVGTLIALAVLLPLLGFFLLADEMDEVGSNNYQFLDAFIFVGLMLPRFGYQIFPIATLIGALLGLGMLASRSELMAMRAAGVSIAGIVGGALKGGMLLALVSVLVGEVVGPAAEYKGLQHRAEAQGGQVTLRTRYGFWARDGAEYINIRDILPGDQLRDIYIYEFDQHQQLRLATHAKAARYEAAGWVLADIQQSKVSDDGVEVHHLEQAGWDSLLDPGLLRLVVVDPEALSIGELYRYIRFLNQGGQEAEPYELAFWRKIVHPFIVLAMIFIAIPILFGSTRTAGLGARIFLGLLVGIVFAMVSQTFAYFALLYDMSPLVAAVSPTALFLVSAVWVLRRFG